MVSMCVSSCIFSDLTPKVEIAMQLIGANEIQRQQTAVDSKMLRAVT